MNDWSLGKGIGYAGMWICIAIIVASLIAFADSSLNDDKYYPREPVMSNCKMDQYGNTICMQDVKVNETGGINNGRDEQQSNGV